MKLNLIKKYILIGLVLTSGMLEAKSEISLGESALNWAYTNLFVVLAGVVILGAFLTLFTLLNNLLLNQRRELLISQGVDVDAVSNSNKTPFFTRLYSKAWSLVPMDKENDIDLGHDYDGIRELDNRLPPWWVYLFYITILWAGVYIYYSHFRENKVSQSVRMIK